MYKYKIVIERVVDGDTIDVAIDLGFDIWTRQRLRLADIDAPETRTLDLEEKAAGLAAAAWLVEKLDSGQELLIETTKTGKYGRYLATLYIDGVNINDLMIQEGHAKVYE